MLSLAAVPMRAMHSLLPLTSDGINVYEKIPLINVNPISDEQGCKAFNDCKWQGYFCRHILGGENFEIRETLQSQAFSPIGNSALAARGFMDNLDYEGGNEGMACSSAPCPATLAEVLRPLLNTLEKMHVTYMRGKIAQEPTYVKFPSFCSLVQGDHILRILHTKNILTEYRNEYLQPESMEDGEIQETTLTLWCPQLFPHETLPNVGYQKPRPSMQTIDPILPTEFILNNDDTLKLVEYVTAEIMIVPNSPSLLSNISTKFINGVLGGADENHHYGTNTCDNCHDDRLLRELLELYHTRHVNLVRNAPIEAEFTIVEGSLYYENIMASASTSVDYCAIIKQFFPDEIQLVRRVESNHFKVSCDGKVYYPSQQLTSNQLLDSDDESYYIPPHYSNLARAGWPTGRTFVSLIESSYAVAPRRPTKLAADDKLAATLEELNSAESPSHGSLLNTPTDIREYMSLLLPTEQIAPDDGSDGSVNMVFERGTTADYDLEPPNEQIAAFSARIGESVCSSPTATHGCITSSTILQRSNRANQQTTNCGRIIDNVLQNISRIDSHLPQKQGVNRIQSCSTARNKVDTYLASIKPTRAAEEPGHAPLTQAKCVTFSVAAPVEGATPTPTLRVAQQSSNYFKPPLVASPATWLNIIVSDSVVEWQSEVIRSLNKNYHISCVDYPLGYPLAYILDSTTCICIMRLPIGTGHDPQFGELKHFVKYLTQQAFKWSTIWLVVIDDANDDSSDENKSSRISQTGAQIVNPFLLQLYRTLARFPITVATRYLTSTTSLPALISCALNNAACISARSHACLNTSFVSREFLTRFHSSTSENFEAASFQQQQVIFEIQCEFLQSFPSINKYTAAQLLVNYGLKELVGLALQYLKNPAADEVVTLLKSRIIPESRFAQFAELLRSHIGL
jgi:hypothetical protein